MAKDHETQLGREAHQVRWKRIVAVLMFGTEIIRNVVWSEAITELVAVLVRLTSTGSLLKVRTSMSLIGGQMQDWRGIVVVGFVHAKYPALFSRGAETGTLIVCTVVLASSLVIGRVWGRCDLSSFLSHV